MPSDGEKKKVRFSIGYLILAFWAVLLIQQVWSAYAQPNRISYSDFKAAVAGERIQEIAVGQTLIRGRFKPDAPGEAAPPPPTPPPARAAAPGGRPFETVRVDDADLMRDVAKHGVKVTGVVETNLLRDALSWVLPIALFAGFWLLVMRRMGQGGQNGF